ncbi:MAG: RagB/SusD family nutrient uptake outer membrane protein [Chitinophagaceae bacterium]|nr:MAG: RagB/SusD family nutrient uptake outer membrane protein [Chitinophagaceae bacterium]
MRKQLKYILVLSCVGMFYTSCQREKLEPLPETFIADATAFDTPDRVLNSVRGMYTALKNGALYGGRVLVYGDIRGEDFINETGNLVTGADVWNHNATNSSANSVESLWSQAYYVINSTNVFLEGMDVKGETVVGQALAKNYRGEARLIRALSYWALLQHYARPYADGNGSRPGVPLRLTAIKGPGSSKITRSTVAEVYTQILADLDFAEQNLPLNYSSAALNTTRAHRNTAIALKTRVYLGMQRYDKVVEEANKIVPQAAPFTATSGVAHALQADIASVFTSYTTAESILSMPMSSTAGDFPGTQNQLGYYFYQNGSTPGSAEYSLNQNGIIANTNWGADDKRRQFIFLNTTSNKRYLSKYKTPSPYTDYVPVMRWSEVLLNLAEGLARTTAGSANTRALALVNAVRQRSDAAATVTAATQQELIDAILLERRIEFIGEGLRAFDITRLLQTFPAKGSAQAKGPQDGGYIWPIASRELSLNPDMTDN